MQGPVDMGGTAETAMQASSVLDRRITVQVAWLVSKASTVL